MWNISILNTTRNQADRNVQMDVASIMKLNKVTVLKHIDDILTFDQLLNID